MGAQSLSMCIKGVTLNAREQNCHLPYPCLRVGFQLVQAPVKKRLRAPRDTAEAVTEAPAHF